MDTETISGAASTIASLLVILFLLAGAAFLVGRLRGRVPGVGASGKANGKMPISILASRPLGGQHSLIVAQANGQHFLLGLSRGGITLISRVDADE